MRKLIFLSSLWLMCFSAKAQMMKPVVGIGTTFSYSFDLHGQHAPFDVSVKSITDTLKLSWRIRGLAGGTYSVSPAAWQKADKLNFAQPQAFANVKLPADQTFMMISKNAFKQLMDKHHYTYDNTVYDLKDDLKTNPLMLAGQMLDVLHVTAENESTEFWILNNPDYPVICQIKGNPLGINVEISSIK